MSVPLAAPLQLDAACARLVAQLRLAARGAIDDARLGTRRRPRAGASLSFREHRAYVPGDDVRHLDWHVLARTGRAHVKVFDQEAQMALLLLLDAAPSMHYGQGPAHKLWAAALLAQALAQMALGGGDAAGLWAMGQDVAEVPLGAGRAQQGRIAAGLARALQRPQPGDGDKTALQLARLRRPMRIVLLSDWLSPSVPLAALLQALRGRGHAVSVVHVLHSDERDLPFAGTRQFLSPDGSQQRLVDVGEVRGAYLQAQQRWQQQLQACCAAARAQLVVLTPPGGTAAALRALAG